MKSLDSWTSTEVLNVHFKICGLLLWTTNNSWITCLMEIAEVDRLVLASRECHMERNFELKFCVRMKLFQYS